MFQLVLLSNSNARLCKGLANIDAKLQIILKADSRALALPIPKIPAAFIDLLPIKSIDQLEVVESLLSVDNEDCITLRENLAS